MAKEAISRGFSGPQKGISYSGNHAYAYSGVVDVNNTDNTLLLFVTGNEYIQCKLAIQNGSGSGDDMRYTIKFNGEIVIQIYSGTSDVFNQFQFPLNLTLPSHTTIEVIAYNVSTGSLRAHTATLTGRTYS